MPDRDRSIPGDSPCQRTRNLNHTERFRRSLVLLTDNDMGFWCSGAREGPFWPSFRPGNRPKWTSLRPHSLKYRMGERHGITPQSARGWRTPGRGPCCCFRLTPRPGATAVSPPRQPLRQSLDPPDIRDLAAHLARDVGKCVAPLEELPDAPPFDLAERPRRVLRHMLTCLRRDVRIRRRVRAPEPKRAALGGNAGAPAPEALRDLREQQALAVSSSSLQFSCFRTQPPRREILTLFMRLRTADSERPIRSPISRGLEPESDRCLRRSSSASVQFCRRRLMCSPPGSPQAHARQGAAVKRHRMAGVWTSQLSHAHWLRTCVAGRTKPWTFSSKERVTYS